MIRAASTWAAAVLGLAIIGAPATGRAVPRVGIFIGSNGAPEGRTPLEHAESDARRMRRVFVELGGVAPEHAHLLEAPSADDILDLITRAASGAQMLVFYYSGHADERALLLDGSELPFSDLTETLEASGAQLSLHLVDACRSGALTRRKGASLGEPFHLGSEQRGEGKVVITSSAEWEDSLESDRLGGSFFTLHMATGLRGAADGDRDGRVTLAEAYAYVYGRTVESTLGARSGAQHPTFAYDLSGQGDLVLTWPTKSGGTVLFGDGDYVVIEATTGRVAAEVTTKNSQVNLPAGEYRVRKRTRSEVLSGRLRLARGDTRAADSVLSEREAHARLVRKGGHKDPRLSHSIRLMGGVRGPVSVGLGAAAMFRLGYEVNLPWLSVMPYATLTSPATFETPRLRYRTTELGAGVFASRALDFRYLTLRGGLMVEALRLSQAEAEGREPTRASWGTAFAAHAGLESPPFLGDFVASAGAEAALYVFRSSDANQEPAGVGEIATRPTYRVFLALGYEF